MPAPLKEGDHFKDADQISLTPDDEGDLDLAWELMEEADKQNNSPAAKLQRVLDGVAAQYGTEPPKPEDNDLSKDDRAKLKATLDGAKEFGDSAMIFQKPPQLLEQALQQ